MLPAHDNWIAYLVFETDEGTRAYRWAPRMRKVDRPFSVPAC
jgi:hypothetical protein